MSRRASRGRALALAWAAALAIPLAVRLWNALAGPLMWGYDAWGHVAYVAFLDLFGGLPWPDQGWSYFHPPLHYAIGWLLARARDAEVLMRGLALWSSAASLGVAALAAWCARRAAPERPLLAPLAFGAVAFLPAHLLLSPMPGNELTLALLSSASLCLFIANESRPSPRPALDAGAGALAGLALLTKFSGILPVLTAVATLALRCVLERRSPARAAGRAALLAGVALLVAAPYYQRNVLAYGNPFQMSRDFPLVARIESGQLPGARSPGDYLRFPLGVFTDPDPQRPHMLRSVWGTVYANVWADVFRGSGAPHQTFVHLSAGWMAGLGLLPTALFLAGAWLAARDLWRQRRRAAEGGARDGPRRAVHRTLLVHAAGALAVFAVFSWQVPIWSALKSSYLLWLSLPFGVFLARSIEALAARGRALRLLALLWLGATALLGAALATEGLVLPRRADAPATAPVRFHFGDHDGARRVYWRLYGNDPRKTAWLDGLAALALAEGRFARARELYAEAIEAERPRQWNRNYRRGQLAVAAALAGDREAAARELDAVLETSALPELVANRGVLHALAREAERAEEAYRRALESNPELLPTRLNLADLLEAQGREAEARRERAEAARRACTPPRRYPHPLGTGEILEWGIGRRALLRALPDGPVLASADFYRDACRRLGGAT